MTDEPQDGGAMDPAIARVLLFHREAIAQATETAFLELHALGFDSADASDIIRAPVDWTRRRYPSPATT